MLIYWIYSKCLGSIEIILYIEDDQLAKKILKSAEADQIQTSSVRQQLAD